MCEDLLGFNLSNTGEQIRLYNHLDAQYLSIFYQNTAPWPLLANGLGYTCERTSTVNDPNNGASWFSGCIGGSPGAAPGNILAGSLSIYGNSTVCTGGTVQLGITVIPGYQYQWRRNSVNISGATDTVYSAQTAGTYTVLASFNGCSSISDSFALTVVSQGPDPVVSNTYRCGPGSLTLNASSTDTIYWFDAPAGNLLASGSQYSTPHLTSNTTYYLQTSLGCPSNLVSMQVAILGVAATPQEPDVSRCGPGTALLTATDTASIRWYTSSIGGALVGTGNTYTTPVLFRDSIFYAEAGTVCPSARLGINIMVSTTQKPVGSDSARCDDGVVVLSATSTAPITWYDELFGGNQVGNGSVFTTPVLTTTTTYYAEANAGCPSEREPVVATVNAIPAPPIVTDETRCGIGSLTMIGTSPSQVYWYDAAVGGNLLHTGTNFTTPSLSANTMYYAEAGFDCRSERDSAIAIINSLPIVFLGNDTTIFSGNTIVLNAGAGHVSYAWSTGASTQTITVGTTNTYSVLVLDTNGCANTDDIFVDVITGTNNFSFNASVIIYPNPVFDNLHIEIFSGRSSKAVIRLMDVQGRVLQSRDEQIQQGENKFELDLSRIMRGIYFLEVYTEQSGKITRLIKE